MSGGIVGGSKMSNVLKAKEDLLKTPEQLEAEKREIIAARTPRLDLERKSKDDLINEVQEFYKTLVHLHSYIYDLSERNMAQKYEMTELAERARQIEKGKSKNRSKNVFTGLGGSVFSRLAEFFPQAPPKISLFSPFERVNDRRTLAERREMFTGQTLIKDNREARPPSKFDTTPTPNTTNKKLKKKKDIQESEDTQTAATTAQSQQEDDTLAQEETAPTDDAPPEEEN